MSGKINAATLVSDSKVVDIINSAATKSEKIRRLFALTNDRSTVAYLLNIRYQHVRNVLLQEVTKKDVNVITEMTEEHLAG